MNRLRGALNTKEVSVSFRFVSFRILIEMRMLSSRLNALNSLLYSSPSRLHSSSSSASASTSSRREERRSSSSCVLRGDREGANASTSRRSRRSLSLRTAKGNVEMQQHSSQEKHTSFGVVRQWDGHTDVVTGLHLRERFFEVPLDYSDVSNGEKIVVFAREVVSSRRPSETLPYLVYLQGGPGFEAPRPLEAA